MEEDKMMELDKIVFEWWYNTDGVSLLDIFRHFDTKVCLVANAEKILKNCWLISI